MLLLPSPLNPPKAQAVVCCTQTPHTHLHTHTGSLFRRYTYTLTVKSRRLMAPPLPPAIFLRLLSHITPSGPRNPPPLKNPPRLSQSLLLVARRGPHVPGARGSLPASANPTLPFAIRVATLSFRPRLLGRRCLSPLFSRTSCAFRCLSEHTHTNTHLPVLSRPKADQRLDKKNPRACPHRSRSSHAPTPSYVHHTCLYQSLPFTHVYAPAIHMPNYTLHTKACVTQRPANCGRVARTT